MHHYIYALHAPCHAPLSCPPSCHAPDVRSPSCVPAVPSLCHAPVVPSPSCIPLCVPLVLAACEMKFTGQLYRATLPCPYWHFNYWYLRTSYLEGHIDVGLADSHRGRWQGYGGRDSFIFPNLLPLADIGEAQHRVKTPNINDEGGVHLLRSRYSKLSRPSGLLRHGLTAT